MKTYPDAQLSWTAARRARPCWRCRVRRLWRGRQHFGCRALPVLLYIAGKPEDPA